MSDRSPLASNSCAPIFPLEKLPSRDTPRPCSSPKVASTCQIFPCISLCDKQETRKSWSGVRKEQDPNQPRKSSKHTPAWPSREMPNIEGGQEMPARLGYHYLVGSKTSWEALRRPGGGISQGVEDDETVGTFMKEAAKSTARPALEASISRTISSARRRASEMREGGDFLRDCLRDNLRWLDHPAVPRAEFRKRKLWPSLHQTKIDYALFWKPRSVARSKF